MNADSVVKMVPTALVVGVVCYCAWPYIFGESEEQTIKRPPVAEISTALLSPTVSPMPSRNPFQDAETARLAAKHKKAAAVLKTAGGKSAPGAKSAAGKKKTAGASSSPAGNATKTKPQAAPSEMLRNFAVQATSVHDNQPLAVINGRVYQTGDSLRWSGPTPGPRCVVSHILRDKVLLQCAGKTYELKYSDTARSPSSTAKGKSSGPTAEKKASPPSIADELKNLKIQ
jgi:hypothetical protein